MGTDRDSDEEIELTSMKFLGEPRLPISSQNSFVRRNNSSNDIHTVPDSSLTSRPFNSLPGRITGVPPHTLGSSRSLTNSPLSSMQKFIDGTRLNEPNIRTQYTRRLSDSENDIDELEALNGHLRQTKCYDYIIQVDRENELIYGTKYVVLKNYFKRLIFMYILNVFGYFYLHFVSLSHIDDTDVDFTTDELIFFLTIPAFCLFPVNHLLSKNNKKHYLTYVLGYFNGINFSVINNIGNLDEFVLDTYNFKSNDSFHILVLVLLCILCVYSVGYTIYVTKKRALVSTLMFLLFGSFASYCLYMAYAQNCTIHIHHYLIGIFLAAISYHPKYVTLIISSVSFGVYLEGIVQWGYAPITYC